MARSERVIRAGKAFGGSLTAVVDELQKIEGAGTSAGRYVAIEVPALPDGHLASLVESLWRYQAIAIDQIDQKYAQGVDELAKSLTPAPVLPPVIGMTLAEQAERYAMELASTRWLTAAEVAELAGSRLKNPATLVGRWRRERKIFSIEYGEVELFPLYALDPDRGYRPYTVVEAVMGALGLLYDGWRLARWFATPHSGLVGHRPMDRIADWPKRILELAYQAKEDRRF
jgi:hypothetical protein